VSYGPLGAPRDPKLVRDGKAAFTEVTFEKKDWTPAGDLTFGFSTAFSSHSVARLEPDALAQRAKGLGLDSSELCPWTFPYGSEKPESAQQAQSCRNLVYARWGFPFKKKVYRDLFYAGGKSWHKPREGGQYELVRDPEPLADFRMEWTSKSERRLLEEIRFEGEAAPKPPEADRAPKPSREPNKSRTPTQKAPPAKAAPAPRAASPRPEEKSGCTMAPTRPPRSPLWPFVVLPWWLVRLRWARRSSRD
jgi:hypothetical protein